MAHKYPILECAYLGEIGEWDKAHEWVVYGSSLGLLFGTSSASLFLLGRDTEVEPPSYILGGLAGVATSGATGLAIVGIWKKIAIESDLDSPERLGACDY